MTSKKEEEMRELEVEKELGGFLGKRLDGIVPDVMKKVFFTSLGALFLTEDNIRSSLNELKIPKDMVGYLVNQSSKGKKELFQAIAREFANLFASADMEEVLRNALTGMTVEMEMKVRFSPSEEDGQGGQTMIKVKKVESQDDE